MTSVFDATITPALMESRKNRRARLTGARGAVEQNAGRECKGFSTYCATG
jgi:hypothetical protein